MQRKHGLATVDGGTCHPLQLLTVLDSHTFWCSKMKIKERYRHAITKGPKQKFLLNLLSKQVTETIS